MQENKYTVVFFVLCNLSITLMLISNILAGRMIQFFAFRLTGGVIVFPFMYILGDIIIELYGLKKAKLVILGGFLANLIMVFCFAAVIRMPYPDSWLSNDAYITVLGTTPRILVGSMAGYLCGGYLNAYVMDLVKRATKGKYLWVRTISSTIVGEVADTALFIVIVFANSFYIADVVTLIVVQSLFKIMIEVLMTPVLYAVVKNARGYFQKLGDNNAVY